MNTTRIIMAAVGGQGNLFASGVLGEAALMSDIPVRMSEIHGMAQRGGVVESSIVMGDAASTVISDGEADILVGFEPLETLRALKKCHEDTEVITNVCPLPPFTVSIGRGVYPDLDEVQKLIRAKTAGLRAIDAAGLAKEAGNPLAVNMVLLGALVEGGKLPIRVETVKNAIRSKTKQAFVESNLKAFELGFSAASKKQS